MPSLAADALETCAVAPLPYRGRAMPAGVPGGVVAWEGEQITYAGSRGGFDGEPDEVLEGRTIVPGFVDCHTHLPFIGWRDDEYEARLEGRTYRDLAGEGGIPRSARLLAEADDEQVLEFCRPLLEQMLSEGTTALELKTGYGLSVEAELRQARLARRLAEEVPQTVSVTLLAGHAVPERVRREEWVHRACDELIPAAAEEGLVDAVDVYVEDIGFTVEDLRAFAHATFQHGLRLRCHADQLGASGATEAAAALGARSADHLNHVGAAGITALGRSDTCAVLLPTASLLLRIQPPPVDRLLKEGAAVAIATDFNPGTSPVLSMPQAIAVACALYGLSPATALLAATANPAWVLGRSEAIGSLEPGKRADLLVMEGDDFRMLPYRPGHRLIERVYVGGDRAR